MLNDLKYPVNMIGPHSLVLLCWRTMLLQRLADLIPIHKTRDIDCHWMMLNDAQQMRKLFCTAKRENCVWFREKIPFKLE